MSAVSPPQPIEPRDDVAHRVVNAPHFAEAACADTQLSHVCMGMVNGLSFWLLTKRLCRVRCLALVTDQALVPRSMLGLGH